MTLKSLLLSSLMLLSAGTAWADVEINETNFPDEKFRSYLLSQDYGWDEKLTDSEIAGLRMMSVWGKGIQSLQGIEYFTALLKLDCYDNQLTSLDVSKNTALIELDCYKNQLTSLDVSGCTALTGLNCSSNQLTSLDVSKNTALKTLYSFDNQLTSLDVSKNTALEYLFCYWNQLTSLDVSKNTALEYLYCSDNQLTSLDVSNTALTNLYCYKNKIQGAAMDALVESLPTVVSFNGMQVVYYENEQNVMTTTQVAAAKTKGWIPYYTENGLIWKEYVGVDPSTGVNNIEATDADDSAPWYTINGDKFAEKPTAPGIYIHGGKKVLVK